jgi:hypothetical protein
MRSTARLVVLLASAAALCACSSTIESANGMATDSGAGTGEGGSGAGAGSGGAIVGFGLVDVQVDPAFTSLFGFFNGNTGGSGAGGGCAVQTFGACMVEDCSSLGGSGPPEVSAGTISVHSGSLSIIATPESDESYDQMGPLVQPWSADGGEDVEISATGGVAPAFDLHLGSPGVVEVSAPVFPAAGVPMAVSTSDDLQVSWTGGAAGASVIVNLGENVGSGLTFGICTFSPEAGQGVVPAGALAPFKGMSGSIAVSTTTGSTTTVEGWQVILGAFSSGLDPQGQDASSYNVVFE